jgi:hypothetical protein
MMGAIKLQQHAGLLLSGPPLPMDAPFAPSLPVPTLQQDRSHGLFAQNYSFMLP